MTHQGHTRPTKLRIVAHVVADITLVPMILESGASLRSLDRVPPSMSSDRNHTPPRPTPRTRGQTSHQIDEIAYGLSQRPELLIGSVTLTALEPCHHAIHKWRRLIF